MKRIDTSTRAVDLFGPGKDGFRNSNLGLGVPATDFNADWPNGLQEEVANVIEAAGIILSGGDLTQLLQAIRLLTPGRLVKIQVLGTSGVYARTPGATRGRVRLWGAGAGGSGSVTTSATQVSVGRGGGSGAYGEHWFDVLPVSQAYTIGAGGAGGAAGGGAGGAGGATTFGTRNAPGAPATATGNAYVPPALESGGQGAAVAAGCNIINAAGQQGTHGQAINTSSLLAGGGGGNNLGGGANSLISASANGISATTRGAGGGGGSNGASTAGQAGGNGGNGLIIIEEYE